MNITSLWDLIYYAWNSIGELLGGPATVLLASLLSYAMIRIIVSAVFKLFRLNIDYHALQNKNKYYNVLDNGPKTPTLFDNVK